MKTLDITSNFGIIFNDLGYNLYRGSGIVDINGVPHKYTTTPRNGGSINYYDTLSEMRHHIKQIREIRAMSDVESWNRYTDIRYRLRQLGID